MIALGSHTALQKVDDGIAVAGQHRNQRLMCIDDTDRVGVISFDDGDVAAFLNLEDAHGHADDPQEDSSRKSGQSRSMACDRRPLPCVTFRQGC